MVKKEKDAPISKSAPTNVVPVSVEMIKATERIFVEWIKSGQSNFLQGYSANLALTDFLHTAGFITDKAYTAIFLQTSVFAGIGDFSALASVIWGTGGILQPQLKSRVDQNNDRSDGGDKDGPDEVDAAISSLATQALTAALEVAVVA